jgi:hypothetical protein
MLPHEGYNMLYAQGMGDESYGGDYECKDDDGYGPYSSSLPCDQTPCFEKCTICGGQFICDEFKGHSCENKNKNHCPYCDKLLTIRVCLLHLGLIMRKSMIGKYLRDTKENIRIITDITTLTIIIIGKKCSTI